MKETLWASRYCFPEVARPPSVAGIQPGRVPEKSAHRKRPTKQSKAVLAFVEHSTELCYARQARKSLAPALPGSFRYIGRNRDVTGTPTPQVSDHEKNAILHGVDIDPRIAGRDNGPGGLRLEGQRAPGSRRTATGQRSRRNDRSASAGLASANTRPDSAAERSCGGAEPSTNAIAASKPDRRWIG